MIIVIVSGIFGIYAYARFPRLVSENRRGVSMDDLLTQIGDLDRECRQLAISLPDDISSLILKSCEETIIGGSIFRILSGKASNCPSDAAFTQLRTLVSTVDQEHALSTRKLQARHPAKGLNGYLAAGARTRNHCSLSRSDSSYNIRFLLLVRRGRWNYL